ncbi:hypothetical protein D3C78_1053010 [compost metagenome]
MARVLLGGDAVGGEHRGAHRRGAAARRAKGQAQWQQVAQAVDVQFAALEQPQRFLVHRAEAVQAGALGLAQLQLETALHQADLHAAVLVEQAGKVLAGAAAGLEDQLEALAGQLGLELFGEGGIAAAIEAAAHAQLHRRRRGDEVEQRGAQRSQYRHQPQVGAQHDRQVLEQAAHGQSFSRATNRA